MNHTLEYFGDGEAVADAIVSAVGKRIVLGLPLGLGKPNTIVNALVERAVLDSSIQLEIFTALTLERPAPSDDFGRRFLTPAMDRLFGNYPPLTYAELLHENRLPDNIQVTEFFLLAGRWTGVDYVQRRYVSANYTHALDYALDRGMNVLAQLVAKRVDDGLATFSLSCNPDLSVDLIHMRRTGRRKLLTVAEVNNQLPFMGGDAEIGERDLDFVLENPETEFELFSAPRAPIGLADHAIGIHTAGLVPDDGTLQIGIGSIGDAVAHALVMRHTDNERFKQLSGILAPTAAAHHDAPFETGLYGLSEMFVAGFLHLAEHGVLKREVDGAILHGGFFVESRDFYRTLREMTEADRARFQMKAIGFVNDLYGGEDAKREARTGARFVNKAMMATLMGAVVSDGTEDGTVISGVGGQYNFVAQAFALEGARSIMTLNATRQTKGRTVSNIVWSYGHQTIPRHLRDIVVTEYGAADLRGKADEEVIAAMLNVADSRFQEDLLAEAKRNGKIAQDYRIPNEYRDNVPERLDAKLAAARSAGALPEFPLGTDYTEVEQTLLQALTKLKHEAHSSMAIALRILRDLPNGVEAERFRPHLERMDLIAPRTFRDRVNRRLLVSALRFVTSAKQTG
jgi:hypothetical protein